MAEFEYTHTDSDGDTIELYRNHPSITHAWKIRLIPQRLGDLDRHPVAVWLTHAAAADLAEALRPASTTEQQVAGFDTVARAEYSLGDLRVVVEGEPGDSPKRVAKALRRLLADVAEGDDAARVFVTLLADILGVDSDAAEVVDAAREAKRTILELDQRVGQLITEIEGRPSPAEHAAMTRQCDNNARGWTEARKRIADLEHLLQEGRTGMQQLRKTLAALGLKSMATASFDVMAQTIKGLGDDNNDLRNRLSAEGMLTAKTTIEAQALEIKEGQEALRAIFEQLQNAEALGRELRDQLSKATEARIAAEGARRELGDEVVLQQAELASMRAEIERLTNDRQTLLVDLAMRQQDIVAEREAGAALEAKLQARQDAYANLAGQLDASNTRVGELDLALRRALDRLRREQHAEDWDTETEVAGVREMIAATIDPSVHNEGSSYPRLLHVAREALTEAAADLTAHAAPDDELDVRVLARLMQGLEATE